MEDISTLEESDMVVVQDVQVHRTNRTGADADHAGVYDHGGVRIGRATADGDAFDHGDVWIGKVTASGDVYDHRGVWIGRNHADR